MNHMLINKSIVNAKMFNAKMPNNTINKKIDALNKKIAALNKKTAALDIKTTALDTQTTALDTQTTALFTSQDANLIAKMLLAEKTRYEKSKISTRLTLIELYKIESDATKRKHLIRLIHSAINHSAIKS
jgi:hypothetical protein